MLMMRAAREGDIPRLVELWGAAFGDPSVFVEGFFRDFCPLEQVPVLLEDGVPASMLALLPTALEDGTPMAYVYALCTDPAARGKGYGRELLNYAGWYAAQRGFAGLTTVPAEPSLHKFFASAGFREGFVSGVGTVEVGELPPVGAGDSLVPVDAGEYNALRETLLAGTPHIVYLDSLIQFQARLCALTGGALYRLDIPEGTGCAAVERRGETVVVKELLVPTGTEKAAAALIGSVCPAARYELRFPRRGGWEALEFGMVRPCSLPAPCHGDGGGAAGAELLPSGGSYLGLAFD